MKQCKLLAFTIVFLAFTFNVFAQKQPSRRHLYRPKAASVGLKAYEIELKGSYWTTVSYFDVDGTEVAMSEGDSFSKMDGEIDLRYGYGKQLELSLGTRFRTLTSVSNTVNADNSVTNSGIESVLGSVKYSFKADGDTQWAMELVYRQASYSNKEYLVGETVPEDEIILGDQGAEVTGWLHGAYKLSQTHFLTTSLGFRRPGNSLSSEIPYNVESAWPFTRWAMLIGVDGTYSLEQDDFASDSSEKPRQAVGATNMFNSINRSFAAPYAGINYAFDSFRFGLKYSTVMMGASTDKGSEIGINILWNSKGVTSEDVKVNSFKEYEIEATIIKVSPRGKFLQIDQGLSGDVEKGMKFDIYQTDFFGKNILVGSGIVYEVGSDQSIIKLFKKFKKIPIKKGFTARGYQ